MAQNEREIATTVIATGLKIAVMPFVYVFFTIAVFVMNKEQKKRLLRYLRRTASRLAAENEQHRTGMQHPDWMCQD